MKIDFTCDALVIGGGPAGTYIATTLSRQGCNVVQVIGHQHNSKRPCEVLAPAARHLLRKAGLREPLVKASRCRGILTVWENEERKFHDYEFNAGIGGLTIDRCAFHASLQADAVEAGVHIIRGNCRMPGPVDINERKVELLIDEKKVCVDAEMIFVATGRTEILKNIIPRRQYFSRLVALATDFVVQKWNTYLLVEAAQNGWWYVPSSIDGRTQLVFLTDADLLPSATTARKEWLIAQFRQADIVLEASAGMPGFNVVKGADARFSRVAAPVAGRWVVVGDAALSLDPLSGTGTWIALAGAGEAVRLFHSKNEHAYINWYRSMFEREMETYADVYSKGAERFDGSLFWDRKRILSYAE